MTEWIVRVTTLPADAADNSAVWGAAFRQDDIVLTIAVDPYDSRMSKSLRPSLFFNSFFTALDATTSPSLA